MKNIVINIDDFGAFAAADKRICQLLERGAASSVSCFANTAQFEKSYHALLQLKGSFDAGVHLNLTFGPPVRHDLPSFGARGSQGAELVSLLSRLDSQLVREEFEAQIECFLEKGLPISHIDNHRPEIYLVPRLFKVVIDMGVKYGVFVRTPFERTFRVKAANYATEFGVSLSTLFRIFDDVSIYQQACSLRHPDAFEPITAENRSYDGLVKLIRSLATGLTEIGCHAGQSRADFEPEYALLNSIHSDEILERAQARLVRRILEHDCA